MVKPTNEQLTLLYPSVSTDYLDKCVNRQLTLIDYEENVVNQADVIIKQYEKELISIINDAFQSCGIDYINDSVNKSVPAQQIKDITYTLLKDMLKQHIDVTIDVYELSSILQEWILENQFTDEVHQEIGGEQKKANASVKRNKITKAKAKELLTKKNVTNNLNDILNEMSTEINQLFNKWTSSKQKTPLSKAINDVKNVVSKTSNRLKHNIQSLSQQVAYDGFNNVELTVSDEYQIVYYRVEVLDSAICYYCMSIDGSINEQPINQVHKNCRGIDVILLKDLATGKYYDSNGKGYGHKIKTSSFETKFNKLSKKQKQRMLGKSNYALYEQGKLKVDDFISYGRQITKKEADTKVALRNLKSKIQTPTIATRVSNQLEKGLPSIDSMNLQQLNEYEKILGYQKQLYDLVPKKNFKGKTYQSYIDDIDAKHVKIVSRREAINKL